MKPLKHSLIILILSCISGFAIADNITTTSPEGTVEIIRPANTPDAWVFVHAVCMKLIEGKTGGSDTIAPNSSLKIKFMPDFTPRGCSQGGGYFELEILSLNEQHTALSIEQEGKSGIWKVKKNPSPTTKLYTEAIHSLPPELYVTFTINPHE